MHVVGILARDKQECHMRSSPLTFTLCKHDGEAMSNEIFHTGGMLLQIAIANPLVGGGAVAAQVAPRTRTAQRHHRGQWSGKNDGVTFMQHFQQRIKRALPYQGLPCFLTPAVTAP